jgi:hypothetical protein
MCFSSKYETILLKFQPEVFNQERSTVKTYYIAQLHSDRSYITPSRPHKNKAKAQLFTTPKALEQRMILLAKIYSNPSLLDYSVLTVQK